MANKYIGKQTVASLIKKNLYSWATDGEYANEIWINDKLTSLVIDVSALTEDKATNSLTLRYGETTNAYVKNVAAGIGYTDTVTGSTTDTVVYTHETNLSGLNAGTIYGGAFMSSKFMQGKVSSLAAANRMTSSTITAKGGSNMTISNIKASEVYGGGAGFGSVLEGDVNLTVNGTNKITNVYGGGKSGAVVKGDVNITISRTDLQSGGKIGVVYGGGNNADVEGNVTITIDGANAASIGTVSGSGKGAKAHVTGTRTLEFYNYGGNFTTTIKNFDVIEFRGSTSVRLTQSQNATIRSASYVFVIDESSIGQLNSESSSQHGAMLTWNKEIDASNFVIKIDSDFEKSVSSDFQTTIFSSTYATAKILDYIKIVDEDGNELKGAYSLSFAYDKDKKGNDKTVGGTVILNYAGNEHTVEGDEDYKGSAANDNVTIQTGTVMKGNINLGEGDNVVDVQSNSQLTGAIVVDKNSTNTIYVDGTISNIRGGDASTNNIVYLRSPVAVGYYKQTATDIGEKWAGYNEGIETDVEGNPAYFVAQTLSFSGKSNDTVYVSKTSQNAITGIDFAEGNDTLVANADITFSVTYQEGNNVVVANENNININDANLKLAGSNNVFVVSNGVRANITSSAIGDFMAKYDGVYLSQNAMAVINNQAVVSSYAGNIDLTGITAGLLITKVRTIDPEKDAELEKRIGEWYTAGDGVDATIEAANNNITINEGAKVNGTIANAGTVDFTGDAGGDALFFNNAQIRVAKDATATVGSIANLENTEQVSDLEEFEQDLGKLTLGNDAKIVEKKALADGSERTIYGNITKAGQTFKGNVVFIGKVMADITLDGAQALFSRRAEFNHKKITFVGANTIDVNSTDLALNNKKLDLTNGTVQFNVLDNAKLTIDGLINGQTLPTALTYTLGTNSRFSYGDTLKTASWNKVFDASYLKSYETNVDFAANSLVEDTINLSADTVARNITIGDGVEVTALEHNVATVITLGTKADTLTIGKATIDGAIVTNNDTEADTVTLNGTTVNTTYGNQNAAVLGATDTLVANGATINGAVNGGAVVELNAGTNVAGVLSAAGTIANGEGAFINDSTVAVVQNDATVRGTSTIGKMDETAHVVVDGKDAAGNAITTLATINEIVGDAQTLELVNDAKIAGDAITMNSDSSTFKVREAAAQALVQNGVKYANVALEGDVASIGAVTQQAAAGATLATAEVVAGRMIEQKYIVDDTDTTEYPEALEPIGTDDDPITIQRTTGAVAQSGTTSTFDGGIGIDADGEYESEGSGLHKPAQVAVDKIKADYGSVTQTGTTNEVETGFGFQAAGESDIKVFGDSEMTLGDVTQTSVKKDGKNTVTVGIMAHEDEESLLAVGGKMTVGVGAIDQTSYDGKNEVFFDTGALALNADSSVNAEKTAALDAAQKITVGKNAAGASITMKAYKGTNELEIYGNTEVTGDVSVGGVLEGEKYEKFTWGDKSAKSNVVNVAADTAKVAGNIGLVGMTNTLTLENNSFYAGDKTERTVSEGKKIVLAGKENTLNVDAAVTMDNVVLADITDYDKVGKEGQDLYDRSITADYKNTINLRGTAKNLELQQQNSSDKINVLGGKIAGNVATNNGNDEIKLGKDAITDQKGAVMGDSTIGGDVTMGVKGAAAGTNKISLEAFGIEDATVAGAYTAAYNATIEGSVEMNSGLNGSTAAYNELSLTGKGFHDAKGYGLGGTASIGKGVTMDAAGEGSKNKLAMGPMSTIGGDVTMTALGSNEIAVDASQEVVVTDPAADVKAYAEIAGKVAMTANANTITVKGAKNDHAEKVVAGAGAYMNGITMANTYADGENTYITSEEATNTITVGEKSGSDMIGSELIVGTSVSDLKDVSMGSVAFKKPNETKANFVLDAVEVAERGHDIATYHDEQGVDVEKITKTNTIDVMGRFSAKDITMSAAENTIKLSTDGDLGKAAVSSDAVRTATFDASVITQIGTTTNTITSTGADNVIHTAIDEETGAIVTTDLPGRTFTSGNITQKQLFATDATSNTVELTGSIVATTGDIAQTGLGENTVEVEAFKAADGTVTQRSLVGNIAQGTAEIQAASNTVTLTRTDVATAAGKATIDQFATGQNTVEMTDSTSAAVTQNATRIDGIANGYNYVNLTTSETDAITQTTTDGNYVGAEGAWSQADRTGDQKEGDITYQTSEIKGDIVQTSTKEELENTVTGWNMNKIELGSDTETKVADVEGSITQTGININTVADFGSVQDVAFTNDAGDEKTYQKVYNASIGGDITQKDGWDNEVILSNASLSGKITQTGTSKNKVELSADKVTAAENKGVSPDTEYCEYHTTNPHYSTTIKSQADFNTLAIGGDIVQTSGVKDAEEFANLDAAGIDLEASANTVKVDNIDLKNIVQTQSLLGNTLTVNQNFSGMITKLATYTGEIDMSLDPVTYVGNYEVNKTTAIGDIQQTGVFGYEGTGFVANTITMKGVVQADGAKVTQKTVAEADFLAFADGVVGGNSLTVTAVDDVYQEVVDVAKWVETEGGYDKEVFTKTVLEGSGNVRVSNKLGAITQSTEVTGNYLDVGQVANTINLTNTSVGGEQLLGGKVSISQKATQQNANVKNSLTVETTTQTFKNELATVEIKDDKTGEVITAVGAVLKDFDRTTMDTLDGAVVQSGFENEASLTNVNVNGGVDQSTWMIDTTGHHGYDQFTGNTAGGNAVTVKGSQDAEVAALGLAAKDNIATVDGSISQIVNNNGTVIDPDGGSHIVDLASGVKNDANLTLAAVKGTVTQAMTYGDNEITANRTDIAAEVTQTTTSGYHAAGAGTPEDFKGNNTIWADNTSIHGYIAQTTTVGDNTITAYDAGYLYAGNVTQLSSGEGSNEILAETTTLAKVKQDAVIGNNSVTMLGVVATETNDDDEKTVTRDVLTASTVESITQAVTAVASDKDGFVVGTDIKAVTYNTVSLTRADSGFVTQTGNADTHNIVSAMGATLTTTTVTKLTEAQTAAYEAAKATKEAEDAKIQNLNELINLSTTTIEGKINAKKDIVALENAEIYTAAVAAIAEYEALRDNEELRTTTETAMPNKIGAITQSGTYNSATVSAETVQGDIKQATATFAAKRIDDENTYVVGNGTLSDMDNVAVLTDGTIAGNVEQTVNAEAFDVKTFKRDAEDPTKFVEDETLRTIGTAYGNNSLNADEAKVGTVKQTVVDKSAEGSYALKGSNTIDGAESDIGDVTQIAIAGNNVIGVKNDNFGNVKQETQTGYNRLYNTTDEAVTKTIGWIDQDGFTNWVYVGAVTTKAITQDANGVGAKNYLDNEVIVTGQIVDTAETTEGGFNVTRDALYKGDAESITQTVKVVTEKDGSVLIDDEGEPTHKNLVHLRNADSGFVTQIGNAATKNELDAKGATINVTKNAIPSAELQAAYDKAKAENDYSDKEIAALVALKTTVTGADADAVQAAIEAIETSETYLANAAKIAEYDAFVADQKSTEYPNVIGAITQTGIKNTATVTDEKSAGDVVQTTQSYATTTMEQPDPDDPSATLVKKSTFSPNTALDNTATLTNVATAGKIEQTVNSENWTETTYTDGKVKSTLEGSTSGDNTATLTGVNVENAGQDITQKVIGSAGIGDNTIDADDANIANVIQLTTAGDNVIDANTITSKENGVQSRKIGTIDQDGTTNTIRAGYKYNEGTGKYERSYDGDVATGAIDQKATGIESTDALANTVWMTGKVLAGFDVKETEDQKVVSDTLAAAKAESITQEVAVATDAEGYVDAAADLNKNDVNVKYADLGFVTQKSNLATKNSVVAKGATVDTTTTDKFTEAMAAERAAQQEIVDAKTTEIGELDLVVDDATKTVEERIAAVKARKTALDEMHAAIDKVSEYNMLEWNPPTETTTAYPNVIGAITQTGVTNSAKVTDEKSAGDIQQTSATFATKKTAADGKKYTTSKYDGVNALDNSVTLGNVETAGNVQQTVNAEEIHVSNMVQDAVDPTKYVEDSSTLVWANGDNTLTATSANVGNVDQIQKGTGVAGADYASIGDNTVTAKDTNLGNINQNVFEGSEAYKFRGNNTVTATTETSVANGVQSKKIGTISQTGIINTVTTDDVETKAIVQNANGVDPLNNLGNTVEMAGKVLEESAYTSGEGYYERRYGNLAAAKAESITQTVATATKKDAFFSAAEGENVNKVKVTNTDLGFVTQTGNAKTVNTIWAKGATIDVYKHAAPTETEVAAFDTATAENASADELVASLENLRDTFTTGTADWQKVQDEIDAINKSEKYLANAKAIEDYMAKYITSAEEILPIERPNVIGAMTQEGFTNTVNVSSEAKAGNIVQKSQTFATIAESKDSEGNVITTTSFDQNYRKNEVVLDTVATAGTIEQTLTSDAFDTVTTAADGTVLSTKKETSNGDNTAYLTNVNADAVGQDVTQTIDGTAGIGKNVIEATGTKLANVTQTTTVGTNDLQAEKSDVAGNVVETTAVGSNTVSTVNTSIAGNIDQKITSTEIDTDEVTAKNTVEMTAGSVGGTIDQTAPNGHNIIKMETATVEGTVGERDTEDDMKLATSTKIAGAVTQKGITNAIATEDVTIKSITQNATATEAVPASENIPTNSVEMTGKAIKIDFKVIDEIVKEEIAHKEPDPLDPSKEIWVVNEDAKTDVINHQATYAKPTVEGDIVQTATAVAETAHSAIKGRYNIHTAAMKNSVETTGADLQNISQSGDAATENVVKATGATVNEAKKIKLSQTDTEGQWIGTVIDGEDVQVNTMGSVEQLKGTTNLAEITNYATAGYVKQASNTYETIDVDHYKGTETKYTTSKYAGPINNTVTIKDVAEMGVIEQTVNGEAFKVTEYDDAVKGPVSESDGYTVGHNVATIENAKTGDVTQTQKGKDSAGSDFQAKGSNEITAKNANLGAVLQTALDGGNKFTGTDDTLIKSFKQTGYTNEVSLTDSKVGTIEKVGETEKFTAADITLEAKKVDSITEEEKSKLGETTVNTITLDNATVDKITATVEENSVALIGEDEVAVMFKTYGRSEVSLTDATATSVTTDHGNDVLTLAGKTTIGSIDMGENSKTAKITYKGMTAAGEKKYEVLLSDGKDVLNVLGTEVDLTGTEIAGVEEIASKDLDTLDFKSLTGDTVKISAYDATSKHVTTVKATTIDVDTIEDTYTTDPHTIIVSAQNDATSVNYTFKNGLGKGASYIVNVYGAKDATTDTLVVGDGTGTDVLNSSVVQDFEFVTFKTGAKTSDDGFTTWKDTTGSATSSIQFTIDDLDEETNTFKIGKFDGYEMKEITIVRGGQTYEWNGTAFVNENDDKVIAYTASTGTLQYGIPVTIKVANYSEKYNGSEQTTNAYTIVDGDLAAGDSLTITTTAKLTDVGSVADNDVATWKVTNAAGEDVSGKYILTSESGTFAVTKRSVTLTSADATKTYDGTALTNDTVTVGGDGFVGSEGATYDVTGTLTNAGTSSNAFTYDLNAGTKASNYSISKSAGTLEVTKRALTATSNSSSRIGGVWDPVRSASITDGEVVSGEKIDFTNFADATGQNTFDCIAGNAATNIDNYEISKSYGSLLVIS